MRVGRSCVLCLLNGFGSQSTVAWKFVSWWCSGVPLLLPHHSLYCPELDQETYMLIMFCHPLPPPNVSFPNFPLPLPYCSQLNQEAYRLMLICHPLSPAPPNTQPLNPRPLTTPYCLQLDQEAHEHRGHAENGLQHSAGQHCRGPHGGRGRGRYYEPTL